MKFPSIRTDTEQPYGAEHDSCAIIINIRKGGQGTYGTLKRALGSLVHMGHRTGFVDGEGDGAGVQTDIPRQIWARTLSQSGLRSSMATDPRFWVGHCFIPHDADLVEISDAISDVFNRAGLNLLIQQPGMVRLQALGKRAQHNAPTFWQIAGCAASLPDSLEVEKRLHLVGCELEENYPIHFASLSCHSVVYKARGSVEVLSHFYPDLQDRSFDTGIALCHARYSTNTASSFERVQPFHLLGHNGEFNTISRFRQEAMQIGARLQEGNSDSQDIDRALYALCVDYGLDLVEAMELVLPPVPYEVQNFTPSLRGVYTKMRQSFGPYAQGPSAVIARYGDLVVCSVDALGLRPLWFVETEKEYIFSSERGVIPFDNMVSEPRPLAPGEKMALRVHRGRSIEILDHTAIRKHIMNWAFQREAPAIAERYWTGLDYENDLVLEGAGGGGVLALETTESPAIDPSLVYLNLSWADEATASELNTAVYASAGWNREHIQEIESLVEDGKDLVGSLGHDGPLAVLSRNRVNMADFFKETVAVVTNPAIDRERETEVFSTQTLVGVRPEVGQPRNHDEILVTLDSPLLTGGHPMLGGLEVGHEAAQKIGSMSIEALLSKFGDLVMVLPMGVQPNETVESALNRLAYQAIQAVRSGAQCILLDDGEAIQQAMGWLDPVLITAYLDSQLRETGDTPNLRRRVGIVVRSASIRSLHDLVVLYGFGADAINPYGMLAIAIGGKQPSKALKDPRELVKVQYKMLNLLDKGLEKVISTIGCHELRGYGRLNSSIGLAPSIARLLKTPNYFGSEEVGLTWQRLNDESRERGRELTGVVKVQLAKVDRFYPKFWKKAEDVAHGDMTLDDFIEEYRRLKEEVPVALRHTLEIKYLSDEINPADVDISVGDHDYPFLISAMSFGSQGELAYKAYAEAAARLNMLCINGEGGELPEVMHKYTKNRGQQIASGRFGVNAEFANSCVVLEIKIGQGAKPGEGGMLPASKVSPQVARARHTNPYVALISPSNNHDIYSIEDLAQIIEELKTVNPNARISVKIPVVPGVGVIAVGVAKAGADIINLTGYDGATGAARRHALQYVGLPAEIGLVQAHRALIESGLRHKVELWCDGGMKTGSDAVKMVLLGANRVGFATMAMVAIGCTICRKCHEGTCHVGITTHITTVEEATEKGLKSFVPRHYDRAVEGMVRIFETIGEEVRRLVAQLGATRLQDLVGRADLLEQPHCQDMVDLSTMLVAAPMPSKWILEPGVGRLLTRPRNNLTTTITNLVLNAVAEGEREVTYQDEVMAQDRVLGTHLAGELKRNQHLYEQFDVLHLHFTPSAVGGNGFAAFATDKMDILIEGGAQDGAAKSSSNGKVLIMKGLNHNGIRLDGSVGKSFAYGAQEGLLIVQGNADSRACIRLSGADVIFGGEITQPIDDSLGVRGSEANLKGFACEYMTAGRVLVMGDIGPYACAGMTGGVVFQHLSPEMGYTAEAVKRRIAKGANVTIQQIDETDVPQIRELLTRYVEALERTDQHMDAARIRALTQDVVLKRRFIKITPVL